MWFLVGILFAGIVLVHLLWRKKFSGAMHLKEKELARLQEIQRETIATAKARQSALLNSMIEGLLVLNNEGRIQLANRALEKLFGVTSDIYGKTLIEAFRNHELAQLADRLKEERQIINFEFQPTNASRWFQINAAAIVDEEENLTGALLVFHDLTRLRELENTRQEFVANVSHELRTPLSMIKGYVETLLDGAKDNPEVAGKFLETIERHTERLTFLIEDLLTISKLESGQVILNFQEGDLKIAVDKVIRDLQQRANDKQVTLENRVPADLSVHADFDRLDQVFWNLIDNAIKYSRSPGRVVIGATSEHDHIKIWVKDDGAGIPVDMQSRVFERFFRVDKARSSDRGGSGLGLAIVKHVVQRHQGKVWVESDGQTGSAFFFTLPVKTSGE